VRLGVPSDGNVAAAGAPMTMYRSPRDGCRAISGTQQTLMTQARSDSAERIDCCAPVGTSSSAAERARQSVGLQVYSVTPAAAVSSSKRQAASPRNIENSF